MKDFSEDIQPLYTEQYFLFLRALVHRPYVIRIHNSGIFSFCIA